MALKKKKPSMQAKAAAWLGEHNAIACVGIALLMAAALTGLFLFIVFSGFGASADFIYNQF